MSKKHVQALEYARNKLISGKAKYIWQALPNNGYGEQIRFLIVHDLDWCVSLYSWLINNNKGFRSLAKQISVSEAHKLLLPTRLAWIDALIEYWKDKQ